MDDNGSRLVLKQALFDTNQNAWDVGSDTTINEDLGQDMTAVSNMHVSIAIDHNDAAHVACVSYSKSGANTYWTVQYNNNIGGVWNASNVEVEGITALKHCKFPSIEIDQDNKPVIVYCNETDNDVTVAIGNANDATSFTLYDIETDNETTSGQNTCAIAVDDSGNHYVAYRAETNGYIKIKKHVKADGWTTWQSAITNNNNGINPGLYIVGSDIYVLYEEDSAHDIVYDKYSGTWGSGTWKGETTLETGTFNNIRVKLSASLEFDYDGTRIAKNYIERNAHSSANFAFSSTVQGFSQSFPGANKKLTGVTVRMYSYGTLSGTIYCKLYAMTGTLGVDGIPTGSALATASIPVGNLDSFIKDFHFAFGTPYDLSAGSNYCITVEYTGAGSTNYICLSGGKYSTYQETTGNPAKYENSSWGTGTWNYGNHLTCSIHTTPSTRTTPKRIEYAFMDETTNPQAWFNYFSLTDWAVKNLKVYLGGSWQTKPLKAYIGGSWTTKSVKKLV